MPRPPFTRFPKDAPLPISQRNEITKAFGQSTKGQKSAGGVLEQTAVVQSNAGTTSIGNAATLAGDVIGPAGANTVAKIQGNALAMKAISAGETYVMSDGVLTPSPLTGDVNGSLTANTVSAIQGVPVSEQPPADQQVLVYSAAGGEYAPSLPAGAILPLWANCS